MAIVDHARQDESREHAGVFQHHAVPRIESRGSVPEECFLVRDARPAQHRATPRRPRTRIRPHREMFTGLFRSGPVGGVVPECQTELPRNIPYPTSRARAFSPKGFNCPGARRRKKGRGLGIRELENGPLDESQPNREAIPDVIHERHSILQSRHTRTRFRHRAAEGQRRPC